MKYLVEKNGFENARSNLKSALNVAANEDNLQSELKTSNHHQSPTIKDSRESQKRKVDSDIINPKMAKWQNFGITLGQSPKQKLHNQDDNPKMSTKFGIIKRDGGLNLCPLCFSSFRVKASLISHVQKDHKRKDAYECSVCAKPFLNKYTLECHIIENHKLRCGSCHFNRASNDESSVEFCMFVLIFFPADIIIRFERSPIHSKLSLLS